jgi:protein-glutamine gamma-glutamyltransferase
VNLKTYFQLFSYITIAVAGLALLLAGGVSLPLALVFWLALVLAWKLEGTKRQLSERSVLIIVVLSVPLFFLDWKYQQTVGEVAGRMGVTALAHLIIFLSIVKLLQLKRDRDWVFLYLISFFEVLLAAGLDFSPVFLGTLSLYLLSSLSAIIAFEIQKSKRTLATAETRLLVPPDSRIFKNSRRTSRSRNPEAYRLPVVAFVLLALIFVLALPLFLVVPRSGAAMLARSGGGLNNLVGFSDTVNLGEIGELKRDNAIVMHVRVEGPASISAPRWRGVALDEYTGRGWRKSAAARMSNEKKSYTGFFQLGTVEAGHQLSIQTVFLEPNESPVLFAAPRLVAVQGDFPSVRVDAEGAMQARRHEFDRILYKALSDMREPDAARLRADNRNDPAAVSRYLQLPDSMDPRIDGLANAIVVNEPARNRYDEAKAIETYLQREFGYTLTMKASGPDPLSDFLFNVKAGHCEYFSTAMAVMLRTRNIPARVVNGFLPGEYNEAAGAYTVRQSDAHSWVEVYFPETQSWVTFDPTPSAGRKEPVSSGIVAQLGKYAEAFELMWFQYVVGYDKQEQRSLATSLQNRLFYLRRALANASTGLQKFSAANLGSVAFVFVSVGLLFVVAVIAWRVRRFGWRLALSSRRSKLRQEESAIEFYQRLLKVLARQGAKRESATTPLEFAASLKLQPALSITNAYNRVRFGGEKLTAAEIKDVEQALRNLEHYSKD